MSLLKTAHSCIDEIGISSKLLIVLLKILSFFIAELTEARNKNGASKMIKIIKRNKLIM